MMCSHSKLNKTIKGDAFNIDVDVPVVEEDAIASTVYLGKIQDSSCWWELVGNSDQSGGGKAEFT